MEGEKGKQMKRRAEYWKQLAFEVTSKRGRRGNGDGSNGMASLGMDRVYDGRGLYGDSEFSRGWWSFTR
ncbi:hypothetical protein CDL15_Pgr026924 [Punica granatum]|uniref:Uncharacterized protein n=1 Tax=Punica granatum TaxID=22663 RepID=A0A218XZP4_PUNGR|nr:hypothetical protein CDL15_Pgr026924 [Punica granatum]